MRAAHDAAFAIEKVSEREQKLCDANVSFELRGFGAKQAFANETADSKGLAIIRYDPTAAALAWSRTDGFLARHPR